MSVPISELIIDNIETTVEGVTTANGYNQTVQQVGRFTGAPSVKFSVYPAVEYRIDEVTKTDAQDHGWQICEMTLLIGAYVNDRTDPGQAVNLLAEDIEAALAVDVTRGGYALDTAVVAQDFDYIDAGPGEFTGVCVITAQIEYEHLRGDPSSRTE